MLIIIFSQLFLTFRCYIVIYINVFLIIPLIIRFYVDTPSYKWKLVSSMFFYLISLLITVFDAGISSNGKIFDLKAPIYTYYMVFFLIFIPIILCLYGEGRKWG